MVLILAAAARTAAAWKNGGGVTREVVAHPAGSDLGGFEWRLSIAEVHRGGPFSVFPGIDRHMAVLAGRLSFAIEGRTLSLTPDSAPLAFGGRAGPALRPPGTGATPPGCWAGAADCPPVSGGVPFSAGFFKGLTGGGPCGAR